MTARGRPVAWLVPAREDDVLARLEAEGTLHRGTGNLFRMAPLPQDPAQKSLSKILSDLRAGER